LQGENAGGASKQALQGYRYEIYPKIDYSQEISAEWAGFCINDYQYQLSLAF
jgi:hypothetical protein